MFSSYDELSECGGDGINDSESFDDGGHSSLSDDFGAHTGNGLNNVRMGVFEAKVRLLLNQTTDRTIANIRIFCSTVQLQATVTAILGCRGAPRDHQLQVQAHPVRQYVPFLVPHIMSVHLSAAPHL